MPRYKAAVMPRYNAVVMPRYNSAAMPRYNAAVMQCYNAAVMPSHNTPLMPRHGSHIAEALISLDKDCDRDIHILWNVVEAWQPIPGMAMGYTVSK